MKTGALGKTRTTPADRESPILSRVYT